MKVAVLCEYFYPDNSGSTPTDMSDLCSFLKAHYNDLEIDVITSCNLYRTQGLAGKLPAYEDWGGVKIRRLSTPRSNRPSMLFRLLAGTLFSLRACFYLLSKKRYDVLMVVTNPPVNGLAAWLYARIRGVPFVYIIHDLYPDVAVALGRIQRSGFLYRMLHSIQKTWFSAATKVVPGGRCMEQYIHQTYDVPLSKMSVIRSWADPLQIFPGPKSNAFRERNGLTGFVVTYGGNFSKYIDFDQILGAAKLLDQESGITFVLIGDGMMRQDIEDKVSREKLRNVRVLPPVPRSAMNEVLAGSDVCLIPLNPTMLGLGCPSKLYAILAAGRPVIAMIPDASEVALVLAEEECGLNVPFGDASQLASAILHLKNDPALAQSMGEHARSALERRFTLAQTAAGFRAVLDETIQ